MSPENSRNLWQDALRLLAALVVGGIVALVIGWAQGNQQQKDEYSIPEPQTFPDFNPVQVAPKTYEVELYKDFVMDQPINRESIVSISRVLQVSGRIASGSLIVRASATPLGYDKTRRHSVYFYIDDGSTGGHLGAKQEKGLVADGYFTIDSSPFNATYPLDRVKVSLAPDGQTAIDVLRRLNDGQKHYIGAFVATGKYGSLDKLVIRYECESDSDCTITTVK